MQSYDGRAETRPTEGPNAAPKDEVGLEVARVVAVDRGAVVVALPAGDVRVRLAGRLRHAGEAPAAGDWVAVDPALGRVEAILPRRTAIVRAAPGTKTEGQVLAANVDLVLAVAPLGAPVNVRRLERFLALAAQTDALVLLTKADLEPDPAATARQVSAALGGVEVQTLSIRTGEGLDALRDRLRDGVTAVLLGPSGAGKSSLVNALLGEDRQVVAEVRAGDQKGRHTTTRRELISLPGGALLLDTPGLRVVGMWDPAATPDAIAEIAVACRFADCRHEGEPGCAVADAIAAGVLDAERLATHRKLEREAARMTERRHERDRRSRIAQREYRRAKQTKKRGGRY